jgi:hypothetical protein
MLKNYTCHGVADKRSRKELKERHSQNRKNVKSANKVFRKQTVEPWTPGILGPSSSTKLEKNHINILFFIYF